MFAPFLRKLLLSYLGRQSYQQGLQRARRNALKQFRRAAKLPAYAALLKESGIDAETIRQWSDFSRLPLLGKDNTFLRFPLEDLTVPDTLNNLAGVLTSSGQSGKFAYGLTTRKQMKHANFMIDLALEATFHIDTHKTLLINALPMGVGFASDTVTVAETSVREDMVLTLADKFGPYYDQIILVTDPLFLKLLCDTSRDRSFDWKRFRVHAIIGEETFGENYRSYVGNILGSDPDNFDGPILGASMGAGELGLNLFFETPQTIALHRLLCKNATLRQRFFGQDLTPEQIPMLFTYSTSQLCLECLPDDHAPGGYGQLTLTPLAGDTALPLVRYQTGDLIRPFSPDEIMGLLKDTTNPNLRHWKMPLIALRGRDSEEMPGINVSEIKEALYKDPTLADHLSGAFKLIPQTTKELTLHVQMRLGSDIATEEIGAHVRIVLPPTLQNSSINVWDYDRFPYGMRLDYERKFKYL